MTELLSKYCLFLIVETAENIGFSCELLTDETKICYGEDIRQVKSTKDFFLGMKNVPLLK